MKTKLCSKFLTTRSQIKRKGASNKSTLQKNNFLHPFLKKIKPHCYKLNFESTLHFKYVLLLGASMMP